MLIYSLESAEIIEMCISYTSFVENDFNFMV